MAGQVSTAQQGHVMIGQNMAWKVGTAQQGQVKTWQDRLVQFNMESS